MIRGTTFRLLITKVEDQLRLENANFNLLLKREKALKLISRNI
jgi:hypothetical protein